MSARIWHRWPTPGDVFDVALAMRDSDAAEIFCTRVDDDRRRFAAELVSQLHLAPLALVYGLDEFPMPCALLWVWPMCESGALASANFFATDKFPLIAQAMVRDFRRRVGPMIARAGVRRLECRASATHTSARRFIRALGAHEEAELPEFGANNETFILCAWRRSEWENRPCALPASPVP